MIPISIRRAGYWLLHRGGRSLCPESGIMGALGAGNVLSLTWGVVEGVPVNNNNPLNYIYTDV